MAFRHRQRNAGLWAAVVALSFQFPDCPLSLSEPQWCRDKLGDPWRGLMSEGEPKSLKNQGF